MRVALFFDGKNHMKDLRRTADNRWLDHGALADWAVKFVGGSELFAAYYYTGVPNANDEGGERHALSDLLEELEKRPGFFVRRFNRRSTSRDCPHCNQVISYTEEKMVDTSLVADMITLAVADAYDCAVVFSGDLDIAPGLTAIHALGKRGWVATFGSSGLSRTLLRSAWGVINLMEHVEQFSYADLAATAAPVVKVTPESVDSEVVRELRRAEAHFAAGGGFVGAHYFIHRWKGHEIPDAPELRRQILQRLIQEHRVETYTVDGKTAIRATQNQNMSHHTPNTLDVDISEEETREVPRLDEDETVEMRVPETIRRSFRPRAQER